MLGVNVARSFAERGIEVKAFVRPGAEVAGLKGIPCDIEKGNITDYDEVFRAMRDCDAVVHAASTTDVRPLPYQYFTDVNVVPTRHVINAALRQGNKRVVHISTANAFDPGSKLIPGTETSPFTLHRYGSGYINSKHEAQQYVIQATIQQGSNAVVINPTFMIGAHDQKPSSGKMILHGLKKIQFRPSGGKNFVHVQDVVQGICAALTHGNIGECYLIGGENLTYSEFFDKLNKVTGRRPIKIDVPRTLLSTAGTLSERFRWITNKPPELTYANAMLLTLDNYYSSAKAIQAFNLTSTSIESAIVDAVEWFRQHQYI